MKRKVIGLLFMIVVCVSTAGSVLAETCTAEPYWIQLASISCTFEERDGWFTNAYVNVEAKCKSTDYNANLTVSIQKKSGSNYYDTGLSWSAGPSYNSVVSKNISLEPGNYIAHCVVVVTDSTGNVIETASKNSSAIIII